MLNPDPESRKEIDKKDSKAYAEERYYKERIVFMDLDNLNFVIHNGYSLGRSATCYKEEMDKYSFSIMRHSYPPSSKRLLHKLKSAFDEYEDTPSDKLKSSHDSYVKMANRFADGSRVMSTMGTRLPGDSRDPDFMYTNLYDMSPKLHFIFTTEKKARTKSNKCRKSLLYTIRVLTIPTDIKKYASDEFNLIYITKFTKLVPGNIYIIDLTDGSGRESTYAICIINTGKMWTRRLFASSPKHPTLVDPSSIRHVPTS